MWEGVWDRTELQHIDPHSYGPSAFLSRSPGLLNWGPTLLGVGFLYCILSPTGLVSKLTDFLSSRSYMIVQRPLLLVGVTIALIQPIHGQGYNSDIPRPDAPVIYIGAFPILKARPGRRSIYNSYWKNHCSKSLENICLRLLRAFILARCINDLKYWRATDLSIKSNVTYWPLTGRVVWISKTGFAAGS